MGLADREKKETSLSQSIGDSVSREVQESEMKWKDEYVTGIQRIDRQHRSLFRTVDDFRDALDEGRGERIYSTLLEFLGAYCESHFSFEEKCMTKYECPVARKNKEEHSVFLEVFRGFQQRYESNGYLVADARELVQTVDRWLDEHICRIDTHLKNCVIK
jgi:hemerythrin-like metal-binding protein